MNQGISMVPTLAPTRKQLVTLPDMSMQLPAKVKQMGTMEATDSPTRTVPVQSAASEPGNASMRGGRRGARKRGRGG